MSLQPDQPDFKHDPIPPRTIRLVQIRLGVSGTIECQLITVPLEREAEDNIEYKAVSYTWGSNQRTNYIDINGRRLPVTPNLYALLYKLRLMVSESDYFWIDAICINQEDEDNEEKNHQVRMMGEIYNHAKEVVIYLGPAQDEILFTSLARMEVETRGRYWEPTDERWDTAWTIAQTSLAGIQNLEEAQVCEMESILQNPWFRRVWIIQEVAKARSATVIYGGKRVSTRIFAIAPRLIGVKLDEHQQAIFDVMPGPLKRYSSWHCNLDLYTMLRKFSAAEATEERDKIFALLGMCKDGSSNSFPVPSYEQPIHEIILSTASYIYSIPPDHLPPLTYTTIGWFLSDFDHLNTSIPLQLVESGRIQSLKSFIENSVAPLTEVLLKRIVRTKTNGKELVDHVLQKREAEVQITGEIVEEVLRNEDEGKAVMESLLRNRPNQVPITFDSAVIALRNKSCGQEMIQLLVEHKVRERTDLPQEDIIQRLFSYSDIPFGTIIKLFDPPQNDTMLTERLFNFAATDRKGKEAIETYLRNPSCEAPDTLIAKLINTAQHATIPFLFQPETKIGSIAKRLLPIALAGPDRGAVIMSALLVQKSGYESLAYTRFLRANKGKHRGDIQERLAHIKLLTHINHEDEYGWSLLTWAAALGHVESVEWLIKFGADPVYKDKSGWSPIEWARANGHIEVAEKLEVFIRKQHSRIWGVSMYQRLMSFRS